MAVKIRIDREFVLKQTRDCQEALAYFDTRAEGSSSWEGDYTAAECLKLVREAPQFMRWLRWKRVVPLKHSLDGDTLEGETLTLADLQALEAEGIDPDGVLYDGSAPAGWTVDGESKLRRT